MYYSLPEALLQRIVNILAQLPYGQVRDIMHEIEQLRPTDERQDPGRD
jgi:hypothetical protein